MRRDGIMGHRNLFVALLSAGLLILGIGAAKSYLADRRETPRPESSGEMLAHLKSYARFVATEKPPPEAPADKLVPDVNTMIERLAARLETTPDDIKGWRMLGWSYFHTQRYEQAAAAYAKASKLDPSSAELRLAYEEAKAKASRTSSSPQPEAGKDGKSEAAPLRKHRAEIRAMVDGLADRLKTSPRDIEGWIRLMRSRVVLGEKDAAATAFRRALEVFKGDAAASGKIATAAIELGLKAE
jgi:cytochrome c-type biogenesis protein CcmH/NrfG